MNANSNAATADDIGSNSTFVTVTDNNFPQTVLSAQGPVLLKFEAEWCGPCKAMKPMVQEIAQEFAGRLTVATLDIDENQQTPYKFGVRGVPTVILFKDGKVVAQKVGLPRKADLVTMIDQGLARH